MSRATFIPFGPVHAFAHPLLTTIAFRAAARACKMLARDHDRRRDRLIRREHGRRRYGLTGRDQREVERRGPVVLLLLDPARDTCGAEAPRRGNAAFDVTNHRRLRQATATRRSGAAVEAAAARDCSRSDSIMACCPHFLNSGQPRQSVVIFSGSQTCGTIEKF
jgi:hypothetical protein